jgi:hypothetical protein
MSTREHRASQVFVVTHRLPVIRLADGSVHAEDGGVPVLLRGLIRTLAERNVPACLVSDISDSRRPLGSSHSEVLWYQDVSYETT